MSLSVWRNIVGKISADSESPPSPDSNDDANIKETKVMNIEDQLNDEEEIFLKTISGTSFQRDKMSTRLKGR